MLEHLAAYARSRGVRRFVADTLPQNRAMQEVFRKAGFVEEARFEAGVVRVHLDIRPTEATVEAIEARWRKAAANLIRRLLAPRSVAVIEADPQHHTTGHQIFRNLLASGFTGPLYPVHGMARSVGGVRAFPSVLTIPDEVDLAVLVVKAEQLRTTIEECAVKGVTGIVVLSPGSDASGPESILFGAEMVERARGSGMRLIGPNSVGVLNTDPQVSLNATLASDIPPAGRVAFSAQSGALGLAVLGEARSRNLGLSSFVSLGDKTDVSGNDLLHYWEQDVGTDVILLYLESFGNPRRFARVVREVSAVKPIVAVKAGRGVEAPTSRSTPFSSRAESSGLTPSRSSSMWPRCSSRSPCPPDGGSRSVANDGGPGALAADVCVAAGLVMAELSQYTRGLMASILARPQGSANPAEIARSAPPDEYRRAVAAVLADSSVDAVLAVFAPPAMTAADDLASAVAEAAASTNKAVVANFLAVSETPDALRLPGRTVPSFPFPERAARALAATCRYGDWRARPRGSRCGLRRHRSLAGQRAGRIGPRTTGFGGGPRRAADQEPARRVPHPDDRPDGGGRWRGGRRGRARLWRLRSAWCRTGPSGRW